ncbi:MAG TPA: TetR/AcrR family transcriptional regulator [Jiangellaceae bacterium]
MNPAGPPGVRKRQARGERRIASLLDAAAGVFAEVGYARASTNAIAARAGASPGTLYQFFPNKEAIADALAQRYIEQLRLAHTSAFPPELATLPLTELLDRILDPIIDFNLANPGFRALLSDPGVPMNVATSKQPLSEAMADRLETLIAAREPGLPVEDRRRCAQYAMTVFGSLLPLVLRAEGAERPAAIAEVKRVLSAYLSGYLS